MEATEVCQGRVKWFNDSKGYGFIQMDGHKDIFVHHSAVQMEGYRCLYAGQEVQFNLENTLKGLQAVNVVISKKDN